MFHTPKLSTPLLFRQFLTNATKAQLEIGSVVSKELKDLKDSAATIERSLDRDEEWIKYHAETLAELVDEAGTDGSLFGQAIAERTAVDLWYDGYHEKAISKIEKFLEGVGENFDRQTHGWLEQLGARIADRWGNRQRAEDLQRQAYAHNRNLLKPKALPRTHLSLLPVHKRNLSRSKSANTGCAEAF